MIKLKDLLHNNLLAFFFILCGLGFRLLLISRGHNFDFDSFVIVTGIVERGENVYAYTPRYNYGPIWFNLLWFLFQLASKNVVLFRYLLVGLLSFVDFFIFLILYKKTNKTAAYLFFLNPMSIIITGYHNQFDNLALLLGMVAVILIGDNFEKPITLRKFLGVVVLGTSIITKHVLFLFPLWLAIKEKSWGRKIAVISVPILMFIFSFIPYWHDGKQGIIQNVFLYKSFDNAYLYHFFVPTILQPILTSRMMWILLLVFSAIIFRKVNGFDSLLLYTCILVIASPAIANQYLAIVLPFVSANLNPFTFSYLIIGTFYLLIDLDGLHVLSSSLESPGSYNFIFYPVLIFLLLLGFLWSLWYAQIRILINRVYTRTQNT